jgi:hypothetical protein
MVARPEQTRRSGIKRGTLDVTGSRSPVVVVEVEDETGFEGTGERDSLVASAAGKDRWRTSNRSRPIPRASYRFERERLSADTFSSRAA